MASSLEGLAEFCKKLGPPSKLEGALPVRVLALEVGEESRQGLGRTVVNPWLESTRLPWPLKQGDADDLTSYGLPLSLSDLLQGSLQLPVQTAVLTYLHALVTQSAAACDQLISCKKVPLFLRPDPGKKGTLLAAKIEELCKCRMVEVGQQRYGGQDWLHLSSSLTYEVWFHRGPERPVKVCVRSPPCVTCAFDMNGVHLTGGRLWVSSLVLVRWLASMRGLPDMGLGPGPVLEIGAGLGTVGIALAKFGRKVVLSDREPPLLQCMQDNIESNGVEERCRVLDLDWALAGEPALRRVLRGQRFSAVVGADVVYDEGHAGLIVGVLREALHRGGVALFTCAKRHRRGAGIFVDTLRTAGFEVEEAKVPCDKVLQDIMCGDFEPDQECMALKVHVPPAGARACAM